MPPVDSTPTTNMGNFELLHSLKAFNGIPVSEYISKKTGLTVVIAEVEGPCVNGYFCLGTEAFDDDGLPHTLEHLIFLGSEDYPFKGVLDLLANRCLASGTNAWTDIDHTCYTMETAGSEGFLALMPIFLEHILYPLLTDEGFITEIHHITAEGDDAGVVYCEMQGRENSAESRLHLTVARNIYPGKCGYSSETGGIMKNLRESTTNAKVRQYHAEFYRPENLKVIITGQIKPTDVFRALEKLEAKIVSKGDRGPFQRPWQNPVPPMETSKDLVIKYPTDDENNGLFCLAWRGPSTVTDLYTVTATTLLLKYLTEFSVSPLPKQFVEIPNPYASRVSCNVYENSETSMYITLDDVPVAKLPEVSSKLQEVLKQIVETEDIDMVLMESIINRFKLESLSSMETSPHDAIAFMIIGQMLYGNTKADLEQRINPLTDLNKLIKEPKSYWLALLKKYLVDNKYVAVQCVPSKDEQIKMSKEEKDRIETQISKLTKSGLQEKGKLLEDAIEFNEQEPPNDMLTSVPIPSISSINFHNLTRYSSATKDNAIDLTNTPVFTYFDHLKTNFVYIFGLLDTSNVPKELRSYIPLLLQSFLELPIEKNGKIIPYEEVVAELNQDTVSSSTDIGLGSSKSDLFKCGSFAQTVTLNLQVESSKYEKGMMWIRDILYKTVFTPERLKVIATKMQNSVAQAKRCGRNMVSYVMKGLSYIEDSNVQRNGVLAQNKFLIEILEKLNAEAANEVVNNIERLRNILTDPSNIVLYIAGNLDNLNLPANQIEMFLPPDVTRKTEKQPLKPTPDYKLQKLLAEDGLNSCIVGMGCLESSYFYQTTQSINSCNNPDLPALMLYLQYLVQAEGPMWKQIRGKGYSYGYTMMVKVNEGLLYLIYSRATNVVAAYKETKLIVEKQLQLKKWDETLIDSARSSLIFELIDEEKTIGNVVTLSVTSYFQEVDYKYNRNMLEMLNRVTIDDLNRVGDLYVAPLFEPKQVRTAVISDPSKANEMADAFKRLGLELTVFESLEESFLNSL